MSETDQMTGYLEHITKSWDKGGRQYQGYIALVRVPGRDTFEVGLSKLRRAFGWRKLTPRRIETLMKCKPEIISFEGKYHETGYGPCNTLQITEHSAKEWAHNVIKDPEIFQ